MLGARARQHDLPPPLWLPRRVDKYLRECTSGALSWLRAACADGQVTLVDPVGLRSVVAADALVFEGDTVSLDNQVLSERRGYDYLAFHKPLGTVSTVCDPDGQPDLSEWQQQMPAGIFPVGRLDRMTSGLLLWSNDGDFANAILHPSHHVEKRYWLRLDQCLEPSDARLRAFVDGVVVEGYSEPLRATQVIVERSSAFHTELVVCLREGKHRQIRKMCQALRLRLVALHRRAIGSVQIAGLNAGQWRPLSADEIEGLWAHAGGRGLVFERQLQALRERARRDRDAQKPNLRLEQWLVGRDG